MASAARKEKANFPSSHIEEISEFLANCGGEVDFGTFTTRFPGIKRKTLARHFGFIDAPGQCRILARRAVLRPRQTLGPRAEARVDDYGGGDAGAAVDSAGVAAAVFAGPVLAATSSGSNNMRATEEKAQAHQLRVRYSGGGDAGAVVDSAGVAAAVFPGPPLAASSSGCNNGVAEEVEPAHHLRVRLSDLEDKVLGLRLAAAFGVGPETGSAIPSRTECRYWASGWCMRGDRCLYVHSEPCVKTA